MKKHTNFLWLPVVVLAVVSFMVAGVKFGFAYEPGNYPGKWYGWWHPRVPLPQGGPCIAGPIPEWEDQKIIKSWGYQTGNSFDEIKHLLPGKTFYENCLQNPEIWGNFRINETAYILFPNKKWWEATKKYKGTPYIDDRGQIMDYKAGCPFPGTKNPLEMAWNVVKRHLMGDNFDGSPCMAAVDKKGHTRWTAASNLLFFFDGRLVMDPHPLYKPNPRNYELFQSFGYWDPYDMKGTVMLNYRYNDPDKQDDGWIYLPSLRRVRRMSSAQRWDRLPGGVDVWWDTFQMFFGKPANYEWKYLGLKELLCANNASSEPQVIKNKLLGAPDQYWQRINCEVLEATPKIVSPISRMVLYLNPDTYLPLWCIYYDKKGREWTVYFYGYSSDVKHTTKCVNMIMFDVQRQHSGNCFIFKQDENLDNITPAFLTMDNLRKYFGGR